MARSPLYSGPIASARAVYRGQKDGARRSSRGRAEFEHSQPHNLGAHHPGARRGLGDRSGEMLVAFALFLVAGISDAVDGFLAKRFHMASELGAYLDPLADKALIVSIYVALGIAGAMPISLVILVVSRDIMIVSGIMLSWLIGKPMPVRPLAISKVNTVAQILLATFVLAARGFHFDSALLSTSWCCWSPS